MPRAIADSVLVVTGASSGIGRATARMAAARGGTVVAAARRAEALERLSRECESSGGRCLAAPTDVTDAAAVEELARLAAETFGRIDAWINNAAVTAFGSFEEVPPEVFRRVLETNLFGAVHGARSALRVFHEQGAGVLINVSSGVGKVGQPLTAAYVTSKFALVGLGESLRQELRHHADIHVCTVLPGSVDTPLFQQGANFSGRVARPVPPVYPPESVAEAILDAVERPRREVVVGAAPRAMLLARRVAPGFVGRKVAETVERDHFEDRPAPRSTGNLFQPLPEHASTTGGWGDGPPPVGRAMALAAAAAAMAGLVVVAWRWNARRP